VETSADRSAILPPPPIFTPTPVTASFAPAIPPPAPVRAPITRPLSPPAPEPLSPIAPKHRELESIPKVETPPMISEPVSALQIPAPQVPVPAQYLQAINILSREQQIERVTERMIENYNMSPMASRPPIPVTSAIDGEQQPRPLPVADGQVDIKHEPSTPAPVAVGDILMSG